MFPLTALSDEKLEKYDDLIWGVGEPIAVQVICRDEDTIIDIVNADIRAEQLVVLMINEKVSEGECIAFPAPLLFFVQDALLHYRDHIDRQSCALRVMNKRGIVMGYSLAPGKFDKNKKKPEKMQQISI